MKADFDIVFKNVLRRMDSSVMDVNGFFEAVEQLAKKIYKDKGNNYINLNAFLNASLNYFEK